MSLFCFRLGVVSGLIWSFFLLIATAALLVPRLAARLQSCFGSEAGKEQNMVRNVFSDSP